MSSFQKKILIALLITISSHTSSARVHVEYHISRVHGLLDFVLTLSGEPHHAPGISEIYKRSSESQKKEYQLQLEKFNSVKENLIYQNIGLTSRQIKGRYFKKSVDNVLLTQSIFSKNIVDFSQRILGLLPQKEHLVLIETLKNFESLYDKLIWNNSLAKLKKHKNELETFSKKIRLDDLFQKAEFFYNAQWPENVPFVIGLYPIPFLKDFKNSTTSHSLDSVEEHGVLITEEKYDLKGSFGVLFHELCHSLYNAQDPEFMFEFEQYFSQNGSKYRNQAYDWINESLATAMGNAWAYKKANKGQLENGSWYNHPTIDGFSKEIYPLVETYLENNKRLDKDFVSQVIELYSKKFPDSIYGLDTLLNAVTLVHNGSFMNGREPGSILKSAFSVASYNGSSPLKDPESIAAIKNESSTVLIVFSETDVESLKSISQEVPLIKSSISILKSMKNRSYFTEQETDGKTYLFVKVSSAEEFKAAVEVLKKDKKINLSEKLRGF